MGLISRVSSRTYREKKKKKMAKRAQVEAVIKTIIREIIDQCALEGHSLSESLVAFMVKAVVIDPSNGLSVERPLTDNDIQELITNCVRLLTDKKSCSLETVRMQVFFDMNYTSREEMLDEHNIVTHRRLAPMCREICDSKARTRNDYDLLYRKIVAYVILSSGLGSPTDLVVVRETTAALHSVYPQTELANFVALQTCDKQIQLDELCQIVTGIRLFNKDCNKGGTGIDNVPQVLNDSIPETTQAIDTALANAQELSYKITSLLMNVPNLDSQTRKTLLAVLYNRRQFEMYIRALMNDIILSARFAESVINEYHEKMEFLKRTVQSKSAVPTGQVYPLFIDIAKKWRMLQEEVVLVGITANTVIQLQTFNQVCEEVMPEFEIQKHIDNTGTTVKTDTQRANEVESIPIPGNTKKHPSADLELVDASNCPNIDEVKFSLSGFCPISLVKYDGLVLPGLPHLGIMRFGDNFYICSSNESLDQFFNKSLNQVDEFLIQVNSLAAQSPEPIGLMGLSQQFTVAGKYKGNKKMRPLLKRDSGVQTDTHFHDTIIDPNYHWNEWELRRKAIRLANLTHKITHSSQTIKSHFRWENDTQVYLPKVNNT